MPSETGFPTQKKTWPKVLAFDTSGPFVSVSWSFDSYAGQTRHDMARGQAEALMPILEDELARLRWSWFDVNALGVGIGPGNFTGIRIAVSAARGLALGLGIPVFGLDAFRSAYGHHLPQTGTLISLPAPRDMAYVQGFGRGATPQFAAGRLIDPGSPPGDLQLSFGMEVVGHQATKIARHFNVVGHNGFATAGTLNQAEMTEFLYQEADAFPPPPAPLYIRPPDAAPARHDGLRLL